MGFFHTVVEGQSLDDLGATYGVPADDIWSHPQNEHLHPSNGARDLSTGDRVWIPTDSNRRPTRLRQGLGRALSPPAEGGGAGRALSAPLRTGRAHQLIMPLQSDAEVQWLDHRAEPLAGWAFRAVDGGWSQAGTLDQAGTMRLRLQPGARRVEIEILETSLAPLQQFVGRGIPAIDVGQRPPRALTRFAAVLDVGALGRAQDDRSVVQRLTSLGYFDNHFDGMSTFDMETIQNDAILWRRLERGRARFRRDQGFRESQTELSVDERQRLDQVYSSERPLFSSGRALPNLPLMRAPDEYAIRVRREAGILNVIRRPSATQEIGISGLGMYLRSSDLANEYPIQHVAANLDWVCVALRNERGVLNRGLASRQYLERLSELGVNVTCFDWRPSHVTWRDGPEGRRRDPRQTLEATVEHAASLGATAFALNIESNFRGNPAQYVRSVEALLGRFGDRPMALGMNFLGNGPGHFGHLIGQGQWVMPMTFASMEREQNRGPSYFLDSMDAYYQQGARVFAMSVAMTRKEPIPELPGRFEPVARTLSEFQTHIRDVPPSVDSVCLWPWGRRRDHAARPRPARGALHHARTRLAFLRAFRTWWNGR